MSCNLDGIQKRQKENFIAAVAAACCMLSSVCLSRNYLSSVVPLCQAALTWDQQTKSSTNKLRKTFRPLTLSVVYFVSATRK